MDKQRHRTLWPRSAGTPAINVPLLVINRQLILQPYQPLWRRVTWCQLLTAVALTVVIGVSLGGAVVLYLVHQNQESAHVPEAVDRSDSTATPVRPPYDGGSYGQQHM